MTVARVSNRVYVGTEFCETSSSGPLDFRSSFLRGRTANIHRGRNPEFLQNAADYAQAVVLSAELLRFFPEWMKG